MRASVVVAALIVVASARSLGKRQDPSQIPECAMTCIASTDPGSCKPTDFNCLCKDSTIVNAVDTCLHRECQGNDLQAAIEAACSECANAGVPLTQCSSVPA